MQEKKVQTGLQSVTCLFHNISTLNIIDIVDTAIKGGRVMHGSHIVHLVGHQ